MIMLATFGTQRRPRMVKSSGWKHAKANARRWWLVDATSADSARKVVAMLVEEEREPTKPGDTVLAELRRQARTYVKDCGRNNDMRGAGVVREGTEFERDYRDAVTTTLVRAWRLNRLCGGSDPFPLCARCGAITMGKDCRDCAGTGAGVVRDEVRQLNADERALLTHVTMFGSDGYPVGKIGKRWHWSFRGLKAPVLYRTRREAVASFEAYLGVLRELYAAERQGTAYVRERVRCDDCGTLYELAEVTPLHLVANLGERLDAGAEVPAGECPRPDCKALVYLDEKRRATA